MKARELVVRGFSLRTKCREFNSLRIESLSKLTLLHFAPFSSQEKVVPVIIRASLCVTLNLVENYVKGTCLSGVPTDLQGSSKIAAISSNQNDHIEALHWSPECL